MAVFLEIPALFRMLFGEDGGDSIAERMRNAERAVASRLIRVETERVLIRLSLEKPGSQKQVSELERELEHLWPRIDFIEMTRDICALAGRIAPDPGCVLSTPSTWPATSASRNWTRASKS